MVQLAIVDCGMAVCEDEGHSGPQKLKAALLGGRFLLTVSLTRPQTLGIRAILDFVNSPN
jgi:hypothetical protein